MRLLVFTTLFPWPAMPHHGIFVRERLKAFLQRFDAEAVVIAPVPYIPKKFAKGAYAQFKDVPEEEVQEGIRVLHPRYPLVPKINMQWAPLSLGWAGLRALRKLRREGLQFDLVDAHYLYPDAVAALRLSKELQCPLIVTARGTDVNLIPQYRIPRWWLQRMLRHASSAITVCQALKDAMQPLHAPEFPTRVLSNGVDLEKFRPLETADARERRNWSTSRKVVLSVGHLIERKGHHHLLRALPHFSERPLVKIIGVGPMEKELIDLAKSLGIADDVEFVGALPHELLHEAYAAADVLTLLSSREGWPNVLLESMACGTPVVATKVWGSPEVVATDALGHLIESPDPGSIVAAIEELFAHPRDPAVIRTYAEQHSWRQVADGMMEVFSEALGRTPLPARNSTEGIEPAATTRTS